MSKKRLSGHGFFLSDSGERVELCSKDTMSFRKLDGAVSFMRGSISLCWSDNGGITTRDRRFLFNKACEPLVIAHMISSIAELDFQITENTLEHLIIEFV